MPKILGNSSGKNNKSCRIFHNEFNKIGFALFWFFFDFIRIFKVSANLEETDLRTYPRISQTGPRYKNLDCNWVPGTMAGGGSSIPARGRLGSAGKGWGSTQGLTYDRFRGLDGSEDMPARGLGSTRLRQNTSDLGSSRGVVGRPREVA
jgi:hypothetical protein